jgi:glycerol kinase
MDFPDVEFLFPPMSSYLLALDQGTTSSRAIVYDEGLRVLGVAQREFAQHYPAPGRVEHDALEILETVRATAREALQKAAVRPGKVRATGLTNQRETVVLWDRTTGQPLGPAIVWQDRRTADRMAELEAAGWGEKIQEKTGLLLDPYFSASKLEWMLREHPEWQKRAARGELAAGTIDSWLAFSLTAGRHHVTDVTNASRTMLMNLETARWDPELLDLFGVPEAVLPEIGPSGGELGTLATDFVGAEIPLCGILGDQQAALFGQQCKQPGQVKCTYGTGCFLLAFSGAAPKRSQHRLLTTVAWQRAGQPLQYALEGSVFIGGAAIQWLRDGLKLIPDAPAVNELADSVPDSGGVICVPAFAGLGAPHWVAGAQGMILGLSRGTTDAHLARAVLDGIAFQVGEVMSAMGQDLGCPLALVRVDGGACASDLLMQTQADVSAVVVERPLQIESTALGAAMMAGLSAGVWPDEGALESLRSVDRCFQPTLPGPEKERRWKRWNRAVDCAKSWAESNTGGE